jgi:nicotinamide-nucleotide amidase
VIHHAYESADIVMLGGGMGPTKDDFTKNAVAEAMGLQMVYNEILLKELEERFAKRIL